MSDIKKRAERNGKIRRTMSQIDQTIAKLERMKTEYIQSANEAKSRGELASYNLCKSGINATITQIRRAKEMKLNLDITAELQRMGDSNADFLSSMSMIAKRISKINRKSNFVKLQKEIDIALTGVEQAQAGLDGFLKNTDAAFAAISQAPGALNDNQLEELINGHVTERDLMMDDQIKELQDKLNGGKKSAETQEPERMREGGAGAPKTSEADAKPAIAKPVPAPSGAFDFGAGKSKPMPASVKNLISDITLGDIEKPCVFIRQTNGDSVGIEFSEFPHIIITGEPNAMQDRIVCALASSFSAARLRLVLADFGSGRLCNYDGMTQLAANTIADADEFAPMLSELKAEALRRYDLFTASGVNDINEYIASGGKLPYIVLVINEFGEVTNDMRTENELLRIAKSSCAVGIYTVLYTGDANAISSDFDGISAARIDFTSSDEFTLNGSGKYAEPEFDERLKAAIIAAQSGGVL